MKPGTKDNPEAKMHPIKDRIKETVGNPDLEAEGKVEKFQGRVQSASSLFFETAHKETIENKRIYPRNRKEGKIKAQIEVKFFERIVQLSGFVDSQMVSNSAVGIALLIAGVKSVKNELIVGKKIKNTVSKTVKNPDLVTEGKTDKFGGQVQTDFPSFFETFLTEAIESQILYPEIKKI